MNDFLPKARKAAVIVAGSTLGLAALGGFSTTYLTVFFLEVFGCALVYSLRQPPDEIYPDTSRILALVVYSLGWILLGIPFLGFAAYACILYPHSFREGPGTIVSVKHHRAFFGHYESQRHRASDYWQPTIQRTEGYDATVQLKSDGSFAVFEQKPGDPIAVAGTRVLVKSYRPGIMPFIHRRVTAMIVDDSQRPPNRGRP